MSTQSEYEVAIDYVNSHDLPTFPIEAIFLAKREFAFQNENISDTETYNENLASYLEARLLELFPGIASPGFMEAIADYNEQLDIIDEYEASQEGDTIQEDIEYGFLELSNTFQEELDFYDIPQGLFQQLDEKISYFRRIDTLANRTYENRASYLELEGLALAHSPYLEGSGKVVIAPWIVLVAPYVIWKTVNGVVKTANSMESTAEFLADIADIHTVLKYGVNTISDVDNKPGNACRHILTSMYFRTKWSRSIARMAMTKHENNRINNPCNERHMDLHNNRIGYLSKYKDFRDKQNLGKMSYSAFATNVYTYTSDLNNGVDWESKWQFLDDTNKKSQDCKDCKSDRKTISKSTFIYIDK